MKVMLYSIFAMISVALIGLAIYALVIFTRMRKEKHKVDYFSLFVFGIVWALVCVIMFRWILSVMGLIFAKIGFAQKQNWQKNKMNWDNMKPKERTNHLMLLLILLAVLAIAGSVWYFSKMLG
jgi:Na+-translocating ferredoxin:NAD+ oxidoreductase RnfD subunit